MAPAAALGQPFPISEDMAPATRTGLNEEEVHLRDHPGEKNSRGVTHREQAGGLRDSQGVVAVSLRR